MHEHRLGVAVALLAAAVLTASCARAPTTATLHGAPLEVMATWTGGEQERFERVLRRFEQETGARVTYTPVRDDLPVLLRQRLDAGTPPDVAFLPQPGLLRDLARAGDLVPLDGPTSVAVDELFPASFRSMGSDGGRLYGVFYKVADKSLIWYDVALFERLGIVPPSHLDGLLALARRISATGTPAFAVGGASGWTLTDWFENVYARTAGLPAYDALAEHALPWTDPSVVQALELLGRLLAPELVAGGPAAAAGTDFAASVRAVFGAPRTAAMVMEGDFVAGQITADTRSRLLVDADAFPFPAAGDGRTVMIGGGDVAVQLRATPAAAAFLRFLTTPRSAAVWARAGGYLSPNLDLDLAVYPDDVTRAIARRLLEAGADFRFDLSDLQPAAFGGSEQTGLFAELRRFLVTGDAAGTAQRLEAAAIAAKAGAS